MKSKDSTK